MPFLRIGQVVIETAAAVAEQLPELEAAAAATHTRTHGRPSIWFRTDDGGVGTMPLPADPTALVDGPATRPGIVTQVSLTHEGLSDRAAPPQELNDDEIDEMVRGMKAERPDLDWENTLSGRLLGPASPDRPDFPVWEYAVVADRNPAVRLENLTAVRFPVRAVDGSLEVTSVDEELRPMPSHLAPQPQPQSLPIRGWDARAIIDRYAALHAAGLLEWDPVERGIVRLGTIDDLRPVLESWAATYLGADGLSARP